MKVQKRHKILGLVEIHQVISGPIYFRLRLWGWSAVDLRTWSVLGSFTYDEGERKQNLEHDTTNHALGIRHLFFRIELLTLSFLNLSNQLKNSSGSNPIIIPYSATKLWTFWCMFPEGISLLFIAYLCLNFTFADYGLHWPYFGRLSNCTFRGTVKRGPVGRSENQTSNPSLKAEMTTGTFRPESKICSSINVLWLPLNIWLSLAFNVRYHCCISGIAN